MRPGCIRTVRRMPAAPPPLPPTTAAAAWCAAACFTAASAGEIREAAPGPNRPPPGGSGGREEARVLTTLLPPEGLVGLRCAFSSSRRMPSTRVSRWEAAERRETIGVGWVSVRPCKCLKQARMLSTRVYRWEAAEEGAQEARAGCVRLSGMVGIRRWAAWQHMC